MPKYHFSTEDDDSSYESDDGTTYIPVNTAHYKLTKFDPLKPISKRSIQIQLTPEGLNYFLYNKKKLQSGHIAFAGIPPEVAELRHAITDLNWHEILAKYSAEIIDSILKKGHGTRGYLATGTYSLARRFTTTSGDSRKTKIILEPIKCDYKESRKKYLFFKTLYPTDESYYVEDSSKQTYRLVLPEITGTLYGDLPFITEPREQIKLFLAILKALRACHAKKIICLDLNPYNIKYMAPLSENSIGLSFLIDGGFSNELGEIIDMEFFICETQEQITERRISCPYFAPECWHLYSPPLAQESMDIYSMGKVLTQILNPLAPELAPFIEACCHQEPSERVTLEELEYNLECLFAPISGPIFS